MSLQQRLTTLRETICNHTRFHNQSFFTNFTNFQLDELYKLTKERSSDILIERCYRPKNKRGVAPTLFETRFISFIYEEISNTSLNSAFHSDFINFQLYKLSNCLRYHRYAAQYHSFGFFYEDDGTTSLKLVHKVES